MDAVGIVRTATEREPLRNEVKQWSRGRRRNPGKPDQIVNEGGMSAVMSNLGTAQMKNYNISMKRLAAWEMVLLSKARLMALDSSFSSILMIFSS